MEAEDILCSSVSRFDSIQEKVSAKARFDVSDQQLYNQETSKNRVYNANHIGRGVGRQAARWEEVARNKREDLKSKSGLAMSTIARHC